ncbi:MAG: hypothetical protein ABT16_00265 [Rhodanobacter sp. SCN 65-17]|nr:MAG: hypothetical protein ABT16_00265 [Rhodanobacter sp. SCN 65-17]
MNKSRLYEKMSPWFVLALASALLYVFYTGLYCSDDARYLVGIQKIARGYPIDISFIAERRLAFLLPGAAFYSFFGTLDAAIIPYAACYIGLILMAWAMMRPYGAGTALICALLSTLTPILYFYAGTLSPDLLSALLSAMLLYCTVRWRSKLDSGSSGSSGSSGLLRAAAASGWIAMCGISVKESNEVVAILPLAYFGLHLIRHIKSAILWRSVLAHLGGAIAFILIELVMFRIFSGQWHIGLENKASDHDFSKLIHVQGMYPGDRLWHLMGILDGTTLFIFSLSILATFYLALMAARKDDVAVVPEWIIYAAFFLWPLVYFTIGTSSLHEYMPPPMQARYYAPCVLPAAALIALMLRSVAPRFEWTSRGIAALAVSYLIIGVYLNYPDRGESYWARLKESHLMAIEDARRLKPKWPIFSGGDSVNGDVGLCIRLLLGEPGFEEGRAPPSKLPSPPFFVISFDEGSSSDQHSPMHDLIQQNVDRGRWRLDLAGYYYANKVGVYRWWQPRQSAVMSEFAHDRSSVKSAVRSKGPVPWAQKMMHADLYRVTAASQDASD